MSRGYMSNVYFLANVYSLAKQCWLSANFDWVFFIRVPRPVLPCPVPTPQKKKKTFIEFLRNVPARTDF